jgi:hypothetical protein
MIDLSSGRGQFTSDKKTTIDECWSPVWAVLILQYSTMDDSSYRLIFYLEKKDEIYHYSSKEHPKISKIAKFGCEMLYDFVWMLNDRFRPSCLDQNLVCSWSHPFTE